MAMRFTSNQPDGKGRSTTCLTWLKGLPRVDLAQQCSYSGHMTSTFKVKPTHKAVKTYYAALATYADQSVEHEGALRSAFQNLLSETGRKVGWTLIPELSLDANGHQIRPDGTFRDEFTIERGYWEAKDTDDDLEVEIKKKIKRGYRLTNTIFEDTREGRLYQDGKLDMIANLRDPQQLCDLLNAFFSHTEPAHEDFNKAVDEFKQRVPDLARGLVELIRKTHKNLAERCRYSGWQSMRFAQWTPLDLPNRHCR